ncbi:MAG TPA: S-methyl-5-thioribose-1-phosphate isomerase [Thermoanaerobaculia bacterium]|nr:S-methyl-5-thioribose-1-phosphate isomerase [Thermoanaerobaculia bacterium]
MQVTPLLWHGNALSLLDQRLLPRQETWIECRTASEVADAIRTMVVRGAPAIGVSAAYGMAMAAAQGEDLQEAARTLKAARPTAVNLAWAVDRMLEAGGALSVAERIHREDFEGNVRMGRYGAELLGERSTVLTHCNAGALATAGYGTALGVIRAAVEGGKSVAVFADETRPYLQGARLTAWELQREGIDVTLITDNMAGHFFQQGKFDAVIVGADRIAANGDAANKIGTYTVAVLANAHGVPFYVAAPVSTIDPACPSGAGIPIEERSAEEVTDIYGSRVAPEGIQVRHPAFDVTPARLITAIITERGVLRPPYGEAIRALYND